MPQLLFDNVPKILTIFFTYITLLLPHIVVADTGVNPKAKYWVSDSVRQGDDGVLCEELQKRLNSMSDRCSVDAIETYSKFSEPPWKDLDPNEHKELILKLLKYGQEGVDSYFNGTQVQPDSAYQYRTKLFLEQGGQLQIWRTRMVSFFRAGTKTAATSEQTFVKLTAKLGAANPPHGCPGRASQGWSRSTFMVLPDLSGPDPEVDAGTAFTLHSTWPVLYKGRPMLVNTNSVFHAEPFGICSFKPAELQSHSKTEK